MSSVCQMCKVETEGLRTIRVAGVPTIVCQECLEMELILIPDLVQVQDEADRQPGKQQLGLFSS